MKPTITLAELLRRTEIDPPVALPAANVTPRLTTEEARAQVLSDAARGNRPPAPTSHEIFNADPSARIPVWRVRFTYPDGSTVVR